MMHIKRSLSLSLSHFAAFEANLTIIVANGGDLYDGKVSLHNFWSLFFVGYPLCYKWQKAHVLSYDLKESKKRNIRILTHWAEIEKNLHLVSFFFQFFVRF